MPKTRVEEPLGEVEPKVPIRRNPEGMLNEVETTPVGGFGLLVTIFVAPPEVAPKKKTRPLLVTKHEASVGT